IIERSHPKQLARSLGRRAPARRHRRDLKIIRKRTQRRNMRLHRPPPIRTSTNNPHPNPLRSTLAHGDLLRLEKLEFDRERHLVRERSATLWQVGVPVEAELGAID